MTISDIVNSVYMKTKTNSSSFTAANMLIYINNAYNRVASLILQSDGRWQWDDDNRTDLPIATTTVTSGQQDYSISVTHLKVVRVELKANGGTFFSKLEPIDVADAGDTIDNATTGTPTHYDIQGNSIFLYPIPDFTQSASLRVTYQRGPAEYTSSEVTSGTKTPGFNSLYHNLIPLWVAYDYAVDNQLSAGGFLAEIQRLEAQIVIDYGKRNKDDTARMTFAKINYL
jgi:hypothetical protein